MNANTLKQQAARKAIEWVPEGAIVGVGTGSTVNYFIEELVKIRHRIAAAVSSSEASTRLLREGGIEIESLNNVSTYPVYVDGADEITAERMMIKGGGAALTREKIVSAVAEKFVCIADQSKLVKQLGAFPLPVEVIPLARSYVARELVKLGGNPAWRVIDGKPVVTDNGNWILDVHGLAIADPVALETTLNQITGVVCNGLFARRPADILLLATPAGVETIE